MDERQIRKAIQVLKATVAVVNEMTPADVQSAGQVCAMGALATAAHELASASTALVGCWREWRERREEHNPSSLLKDGA